MIWRELRDFVRIEMVVGFFEIFILFGWDFEEVSFDYSFKTCYFARICFVFYKIIYVVLNVIFVMLENRFKDC